MRIHLGHHFYGAGNLGDDFMLAGFLTAMRTVAPRASYTCCVPFPLEPLRQRFPAITWLPYDEASRRRCIAECSVWLGLGGSPFQSALSRWFLDHLMADSASCAAARKPMFFLGVGVQSTTELADPDLQRICTQAAGIWTRDAASAERLSALPSPPPVASATDLAHIFFRETIPPSAQPGRLTVVANFDYGPWPGQAAFLRIAAGDSSPICANERIWLAQESRDLPGAERALHRAMPAADQDRWALHVPDLWPAPAQTLAVALSRWPSGEWLVTARYHAALAGAWAGSKIVILSTNEKLRGAAREFNCPLLAIDADEQTTREMLQACATSDPISPRRLGHAADQAYAACVAFVSAASRSAVASDPASP